MRISNDNILFLLSKTASGKSFSLDKLSQLSEGQFQKYLTKYLPTMNSINYFKIYNGIGFCPEYTTFIRYLTVK